MTFHYETNILNQPLEWKRILDVPLPSRLSTLDFKRIYFIGIGSSFWFAKIAEFLWREYVQMDALAVQSYDFVSSRHFVSTDDIVIIFSHRGTKTFSIRALKIAKEHFGATTVLVTGIDSPVSINTDIRIETIQELPRFPDKLILVGDLIREALAHEIALKISETSYLPVRSYGIEQFLHGPRVTTDKESSIIVFTSKSQDRQDVLIKYSNAVGAELIEINDERQRSFASLSYEFNWLAQLVWGQCLALELAKNCGTNPDTLRKDQRIYAEAGKDISL